ncbi:MAG: gliding motility-associated C-terminal domain-containing protein, partial [Chitinophagaceae bacterium]
SATLTVTVNPIVSTTFDFGTSLTICSGNSVPTLVTTSNNGITGTWNPAIVDTEASGTYTFTPAPNQCGSIVNFNVTVTPSITPNFTFGTTLSVCTGGIVPPLPTTSENGYDGSWSPAIVNNQASGVYTFTASAPADQCIRSTTFTVTVNPILTPVFSFGTTLTVCSGSAVPALPTTSTNGIKGTWSPATVSNQVSGVYTFTSTAGLCAKPTVTFTLTVSPTPSVNAIADTSVYDGSVIPATSLSATPAGANFNWNNTNSTIGLASSGSGNVPSFTATNRNDADAMATISVTPTLNGCTGAAKTYNVSVKPLSKDVFVPNIFSPNGDGKNDVLYVYGNYIVKLEMRIFNQWGEQVELINNRTKGWDGNQRGKAQPVGVYVYVLKAELLDGRKVNMKGSITLVR